MHAGGRSGRDRAAQLADVVRGVLSLHHEVVLVSGAPGFGTSTFLEGIATAARSAGWRVVTASGSPVHRSMPYATIIDLLRDLVGAPPSTPSGPSPSSPWSAQRLTEGIPDLQWLIGGPRPTVSHLPTQPGLERARLADAVRQVLHRAAAAGRVLVVIDDLQDVDDVSLEILRYAVTDRPGTRVACVVGLRVDPGAPPPVGAAALGTWVARVRGGIRIDLSPLTRAEVADQLACILAGSPPESATTLAHGLSGGSPGLVRVLVDELRRRGVLQRRAGMWLLGPVDDLTVPTDAEPMLAAMLTGVDEAARCAVELLSASEGEVPVAALCRACCRGAGMEAALQVLADRGLVREELRPEGHAVRGTVPLLMRLVAQALDPQRLQELRAALNQASRPGSDDSGMPGADTGAGTGRGPCQGGPLSPSQAFAVVRQGLDQALAARSWREVVILAEASIRRAAMIGPHDGLAGLHEARARGLYAGGHRSDAVAAWRDSVRATPADQVAQRADRLRELAQVEWQEGLFAAAYGHIEDAATLLEGDQESAGPIRDAVTLTRGLFAGRPPLPTPAQEQAVADLDDLWRRTGSPAAGVVRLLVRSDAASRDGRFAQMLDLAREACQLAASSGDPRLMGQAAVALESGQVVALEVGARDAIAAAIASAADAGLDSIEADHRALAAFLQVMVGDIAGGLAHAEVILAIGARLGSRAVLAKGFLVRGMIHGYVGNVGLAVACQEEFLGCYETESASLLHVNVGAGELAAHIALRQGRLADVLAALHPEGSPRRGHWFHASMLAGTAHYGRADADALAAQVAALRALPEPMPWVDAVVDRLEGLRALLQGDHGGAADLLHASSDRLAKLGLALAAAFGWLEWAELGLGGRLDAEASARVERVAAELAEMGAQEAAERGRRLLRGPRRHTSMPARARDLTERELDVARLVAEGLSNPEIAERLFVSTRTVTTHLTHIYRRLGLSGRTALAHYLHTREAVETLGS